MAAQTYSIEFKGYWREENKAFVPDESGIYCVYTCTHNIKEKKVELHKLVYIGESKTVQSRISNHEKQGEWESYLESGQELCYSFGAVANESRQRCEAAMIFKHKPPANTEYVDNFPFDQTTIKLSEEKTEYLSKSFTVFKSTGK